MSTTCGGSVKRVCLGSRPMQPITSMSLVEGGEHRTTGPRDPGVGVRSGREDPMNDVRLNPNRIAAAIALALFADAIQPVLTGMSLTGVLTVPAELLDLGVDVTLCIVLSRLLGGFHWVLLPALLAELIPFVDVLPTWTAAVAAVVWL